MASWLDNDGDGCVDNPTVLTKMLEKVNNDQAAIIAPGTSSSYTADGYFSSAPILNKEILPSCSGPSATTTCVDASLEEIWHMVTSVGYAKAFPTTFATESTSNSLLVQAMDVARGGKFTTIPSSYPSTAWFTALYTTWWFTNSTCNYVCQVTEYVYWGVNAWVGALVGRGDAIKNEWKFETRAKLEAGDVKLTAIIKVQAPASK